jgi:hypothetical protein
MVWLRSYKQVSESYRDSSLKAAHSDVEASALVQAHAIVAEPPPESAFGRPAHYCASAIPHTKSLLELDQPEHRYSPVFSKLKTRAVGNVNDEGSSSLRTQQFDRGEFQVGSFRAITLKATCRSVRVTIASMKPLSAGRAA